MTIIGSGIGGTAGRLDSVIGSGIGGCIYSTDRVETAICDGTYGVPGTNQTSDGPIATDFSAGESITIMDLVYLNSDGRWWRTDADTSLTCTGLLGISLETKTLGQSMRVALPGSFVRNDSWTWTPKTMLYVDTVTPGAIVSTQPTGTDNIIRVVGFTVTATAIYFYPSADYFTHI